MYTHLLIHHGEISLKGRNRGMFEQVLINNIKKAISEFSGAEIKKLYGRYIVSIANQGDIEKMISAVSKVFGIENVSPVLKTEMKYEDIVVACVSIAKEDDSWKSFKIQAKRTDKNFPISSDKLNAELGSEILDAFPDRIVDVHNPDLLIRVEIVDGTTFVYRNKKIGFGGLPVGSSGKALALLSGGIDSPVASWHMMKRGCQVDFVHFHSVPYTSRASVEKVKELAKILQKWEPKACLYLVPFAEIQKAIVKEARSDLRVVLYRRAMLKIAERIANKIGALALITGDSLGQVASQTLENIQTISDVCSITILRPLIGNNKSEIIEDAKTIGTYDVSIEPHEDCCSLFMPRNPATKTSVKSARAEEARAEYGKLIEDAIDNLITERIF
ncbi:MAG: hypothetical protein ACD_76C00021G0005 [uncultured bacterium]|nr:MAG: hypothetical protein ACD_76C00021G0005 [uncultured bacterium]HBD05050.1 tRNA 4-thiouridine(8) synthase ThiI [Candidatus Uhrbacteria bacterium]